MNSRTALLLCSVLGAGLVPACTTPAASEPEDAPVEATPEGEDDPDEEADPVEAEEPALANTRAELAPDRVQATDEPTVPPNPEVRRAARILAGLERTHDDPELAEVLVSHADDCDEHWDFYETKFGNAMKGWVQTELEAEPGATVFYPFAGADFVSVHRLYPDARRYVMVAMQRGGPPPEMDDLTKRELRIALDAYGEETRKFAKRGFFITKEMRPISKRKGAVEGITGLLMMFAEREGYDVLEVEPIHLADDRPEIERAPGDPERFRTWSSVRLHLRRRADGAAVTLDYLRLNLANSGVPRDSNTETWLRQVAHGPVVLKAASHLMQDPMFFRIRNILLDEARTIVQDETAVEYETLAGRFDVKLYGDFAKPNELFERDAQRSLADAYATRSDVQDLPFPYGYRKRKGGCLQYAHTRRPR